MIPEELNRTIQFIIESQARHAAAQEQDRIDRIAFQEWSKNFSSQIAQTMDRMSELMDHQSQRMDRLDKVYEDWSIQNRDFQEQALRFQGQALHLLNLILDRLPPARQN
jgi:hypothetical protein